MVNASRLMALIGLAAASTLACSSYDREDDPALIVPEAVRARLPDATRVVNLYTADLTGDGERESVWAFDRWAPDAPGEFEGLVIEVAAELFLVTMPRARGDLQLTDVTGDEIQDLVVRWRRNAEAVLQVFTWKDGAISEHCQVQRDDLTACLEGS